MDKLATVEKDTFAHIAVYVRWGRKRCWSIVLRFCSNSCRRLAQPVGSAESSLLARKLPSTYRRVPGR